MWWADHACSAKTLDVVSPDTTALRVPSDVRPGFSGPDQQTSHCNPYKGFCTLPENNQAEGPLCLS